MAWGEENEAEEKKAAKDFQKFSSLPQSGEIDFPTMLKVGTITLLRNTLNGLKPGESSIVVG